MLRACRTAARPGWWLCRVEGPREAEAGLRGCWPLGLLPGHGHDPLLKSPIPHSDPTAPRSPSSECRPAPAAHLPCSTCVAQSTAGMMPEGLMVAHARVSLQAQQLPAPPSPQQHEEEVGVTAPRRARAHLVCIWGWPLHPHHPRNTPPQLRIPPRCPPAGMEAGRFWKRPEGPGTWESRGEGSGSSRLALDLTHSHSRGRSGGQFPRGSRGPEPTLLSLHVCRLSSQASGGCWRAARPAIRLGRGQH